MKWHTLAVLAPLALTSACSSLYPKPDFSTQDRVVRELSQAAANKSPSVATSTAIPASVLDELLSPSTRRQFGKTPAHKTEQRFDLLVNDAPLAQVLSGLVTDTEYSILLKPVSRQPNAAVDSEPLETRVSLNLKNTTLFQALDALRDVYGYDYSVDELRILVQPAQLQTQLYHVNYILGQRYGVSDLQVIGGASVGQSASSASSGGATSSSSSYASVQASGLTTTVKSDVWGEAEDALRTVLGCTIPKALANTVTAVATSATSKANASRADVTHPGDARMGERLRGSDGCTNGRALTINQMSGTILARGMPTELRTVEQLLKSMQLSISRQVIIESKIIDVVLNKDSQQGINWGSFPNGLNRFSVGATAGNIGVNQAGQFGGAVQPGTSLGALLGTNQAPANALSGALGIAVQTSNFSALINFLESQGRVHVLSSPRITTMNNQKAVIKVGSEEPFVTSITGGSTTSSLTGPVTVAPTLAYQPFFSGISLDVTPQIDSKGNITLHVHSMVNSVVEKSKLALPTAATTVPFAVNTMNETDSVVKAKDGQVIVIGGLMTESNSDGRSGVPGARDIPGVSAFFNWGAQTSVKRELVILLKSTVVKDDSTWSDDISATGERIGAMSRAR